MESNTEEKSWKNLKNGYKKKQRGYNEMGSIEKSPILRKQYWNNYYFDRVPKIIPLFDVTNTIFVNSMMTVKVERVNGITVAKRWKRVSSKYFVYSF